MFKEKIPSKRLRAWIIASAVAPCAMFAGGSAWIMVLFAALLCGSASAAVQWFCPAHPIRAKWFALASWVWLGVFLGSVARYSANCWTDGQAYPAVPLVLLALACINSQNGGEKASKAGAVLVWLVVLGLGIVLGAGAKEMKLQWLKPQSERLSLMLIPLLLLPALSTALPTDDRKCTASASVWIGAAAVTVAFCVNAGLSENYASQTQNPLFEYCKSLSLFGTVERFESLIACAMTAGWFSFFSLILSVAGHTAEKTEEKRGIRGVWACALIASAVMLTKRDISAEYLVLGSALFWVILPLTARVLQYAQSKRMRRKMQ